MGKELEGAMCALRMWLVVAVNARDKDVMHPLRVLFIVKLTHV